MANRNFSNGGKIMSMHAGPVLLTTTALIGASGAVSSITGTALVSSIVHVSTGVYQINLADPYYAPLHIQGNMYSPVSGLSGISAVEIQNAPQNSVNVLGSASITLKCLSPSGALADPASGSTLAVLAMLNNSSVKS